MIKMDVCISFISLDGGRKLSGKIKHKLRAVPVSWLSRSTNQPTPVVMMYIGMILTNRTPSPTPTKAGCLFCIVKLLFLICRQLSTT